MKDVRLVIVPMMNVDPNVINVTIRSTVPLVIVLNLNANRSVISAN